MAGPLGWPGCEEGCGGLRLVLGSSVDLEGETDHDTAKRRSDVTSVGQRCPCDSVNSRKNIVSSANCVFLVNNVGCDKCIEVTVSKYRG